MKGVNKNKHRSPVKSVSMQSFSNWQTSSAAEEDFFSLAYLKFGHKDTA